MNVTFTNEELEGSKYLGEGEHNVFVKTMTAKQSKAGNPMIEIEFADVTQKTSRDFFPTSGNKFKLAALAIACGFKKEALVSGAFNTESLQGKQLKLVKKKTGVEIWDGKERATWSTDYIPSATQQSSTQQDEDLPF